jgi:phosphocarrier protein
MFTKLARSFPCSIEVEVDGSGHWLNAKSIVKVLAARAREGSTLRVAAHGVRAAEAVRALKDLVEDGFGEGRPNVGLG